MSGGLWACGLLTRRLRVCSPPALVWRGVVPCRWWPSLRFVVAPRWRPCMPCCCLGCGWMGSRPRLPPSALPAPCTVWLLLVCRLAGGRPPFRLANRGYVHHTCPGRRCVQSLPPRPVYRVVAWSPRPNVSEGRRSKRRSERASPACASVQCAFDRFLLVTALPCRLIRLVSQPGPSQRGRQERGIVDWASAKGNGRMRSLCNGPHFDAHRCAVPRRGRTAVFYVITASRKKTQER